MAMEGLLALACAGAILSASTPPSASSPPGNERDNAIAGTLAVQAAIQQGQEYMLRNQPKEAVAVLEAQLAHINGNATYLALLRQAYQAYIKDLRFNSQEALAQEYHKRLCILEPGSANLISLQRSAHSVAPAPAVTTVPKAFVRAKGLDEPDQNDPFQSRPDKRRIAHDLLVRAEQEFSHSRFRQAGTLFEQAHDADQSATLTSQPRWAYCKLDAVVEQLNQQSTAYSLMEREVRAALELAPQLAFGNYLLSEIEKRRGGSGAHPNGSSDLPEVVVRDLGRNEEGWSVLETTNFRIYHNQPHDLAEQVARVAEQTRTAMQRRWFGTTGKNWEPRCNIFLHATGQDYSQATKVPAASPGHSSFRLESGRVVGRRIDLHCDDVNMLVAVLPHETTHTVLAGNFGEQPVPRWADEGMAVLTEPREKIERHLRNLPRYYENNELFSLHQLMQMNEYPDGRFIGSFYAQSVSVVQFLANKNGPEVFTQFVRDGLQTGYEAALQQHYHYRDFAELDQDWKSHTFGQVSSSAGVASRTP